jgi:molecular chaperone GrpE (heat shock protein)
MEQAHMRYLLAIVPLLCAGGWTILAGKRHAVDPASAAVWAASIVGFVYLARAAFSSNPDLAGQIDEAAGRLKDQLASSDVLKKAIGALTASQQTAVENVKEIQEGTRALVTQLKGMKEEAREALAPVIADRDRALKGELDAVAALQEAYCTLWRLLGEGDASTLIQQVATEFERLHLPRVGLAPINEVGVTVDFRLHEVQGSDEPSQEVPAGAVLRVVRPGFRRRGEVLGRAVVVRARAPDLRVEGEPSAPNPRLAQDATVVPGNSARPLSELSISTSAKPAGAGDDA